MRKSVFSWDRIQSRRAAAVAFTCAIFLVPFTAGAQTPLQISKDERLVWPTRPVVAYARQGEVRPHSWIRGELITPDTINPAASAHSPAGFWPIDMWTAYNLPNAYNSSNLYTGTSGKGITIAIVDAYDSPNAAADLANFSTFFGLPKLPACPSASQTATACFLKVSQTGSTTSLPARNSGWEIEINLDTQWVHAIAPSASILLVEANSSSGTDLLNAVNFAKAHAQVVSMSWGGGEFSGESTYDSYFQANGTTFLASSGDTGGIVEWPSVSKNVIAVGGTNLPVNSSTGGLGSGSETAWNGSGGGCSTQEPIDSYQSGYVPTSCQKRGVPDVAASGGPSSAVPVLVSKQGGWYDVYGTSLACPIWAGVIGIADGQRLASGKASLALTQKDLYADASGAPASTPYLTDYRDILSGTAGSHSAGPGWDFVTGLGSPLANGLLPGLLKNGQ